ncbi:MAG: glycosyltransferase involved in cell wall biosynthesis [Planctomycetota bacterium]|jgi:glycosyltransferase involved in cell wall biosynthesis
MGGEYAPHLARELLGRGHNVRGFGAPSGVIPRSGPDLLPDGTQKPESPGVVGFKPDVIIAYDALSPAAFLGARAARKLNVPLVLVESAAAIMGSRFDRFLRWCGEHLWGLFVRRVAQRVVVLDPLARTQALEEGFTKESLKLLPAGVDLGLFRPGLASNVVRRHNITGRLLLYAGRISKDRGLEVLIKAFAQTVGQGRDWSLVLAGGGKTRERLALRALVDRLGVGSAVYWLPQSRIEELPGLMGSATLLAVPALDERVRGLQIPRGLACGLPILVAKLPRFEELLEEDGSGLFVEPGSVDAWAKAISRASGAPEARKRWGYRAREIAEERLDWAVVAAGFEQILFEAREKLAESAKKAD